MTENEKYIEILKNWIIEQKLMVTDNVTANDFAKKQIEIAQRLIQVRNEQNSMYIERIEDAER